MGASVLGRAIGYSPVSAIPALYLPETSIFPNKDQQFNGSGFAETSQKWK
jgi:hypothetical protein